MATYLDLHSLFNESDLIYKVEVAVIEAARIIAQNEDNIAPFDQTAGVHDKRVKWAAQAIASTEQSARQIFKLVLAQNKTATVTQIRNATDATIQTNVNAMVDVLAKPLV